MKSSVIEIENKEYKDEEFWNVIYKVFNNIQTIFIGLNTYNNKLKERQTNFNFGCFKSFLVRIYKLMYFVPSLLFIISAYYMFIFVSSKVFFKLYILFIH